MKQVLKTLLVFALGLITAGSLFFAYTVWNASQQTQVTAAPAPTEAVETVSPVETQSDAEAPAAEPAAIPEPVVEAVAEPVATPEPVVEAVAEPVATPEPVPTPEPHWYDKDVEIMRLVNPDIYIPEDVFFLDAPVQKIALGAKGICINSYAAPEAGSDELEKIKNNTPVTVLAVKNDRVLFKTDGGYYAWGSNKLIVNEHSTPYLVEYKQHVDGKKMVMDHESTIPVFYEPYGIFGAQSTMAPDTPVTAYKTIGDYTYVESDTVCGWVYKDCLH